MHPDGQSAAARLAPPQAFYVLAETPCPYLPGRLERKLLTDISGPGSRRLYDLLSRAGFRRSHSFAYRPACHACQACVAVRVRAEAFEPSKSQKRALAANQGLTVEECGARATQEQYRLFDRYIRSRHGDGDMARMGFADYRAMVEETCLDTRVAEFRDPQGRLVAACLSDWLEDGPSAVYSFFEPDLAGRSLGTYMVLWLIQEAQRRRLAHVYLGYWIRGARKMAYKARFQPAEGFGPNGWQPIES